jgi:hypothetical protein
MKAAIMPNQASSVGVGWGVLAIVAAAGFVALAEYENRAEPVLATTHPVQPARS